MRKRDRRRQLMDAGGGNVLGKTAQIQMSAGSITLNGVEASNVLIQGTTQGKEVALSTLGADMARGTLTGNRHLLVPMVAGVDQHSSV